MYPPHQFDLLSKIWFLWKYDVSIKITAQFFPSWKYLSLEWDINPSHKTQDAFLFYKCRKEPTCKCFPTIYLLCKQSGKNYNVFILYSPLSFKNNFKDPIKIFFDPQRHKLNLMLWKVGFSFETPNLYLTFCIQLLFVSMRSLAQIEE
jgi:hypothetical protein